MRINVKAAGGGNVQSPLDCFNAYYDDMFLALEELRNWFDVAQQNGWKEFRARVDYHSKTRNNCRLTTVQYYSRPPADAEIADQTRLYYFVSQLDWLDKYFEASETQEKKNEFRQR